MIGWAILLLCIGAALLVMEAFIPGFGVFGISGIVCVIISGIITAVSVPYGIFLVLAGLAVMTAIAVMLLNYLKRRQLYGRLILSETLASADSGQDSLDYFQGKEGVAKTPLKPFGTADFNGTCVEVYSDGGFIKENCRIKVVDVSKKKITVTELKN